MASKQFLRLLKKSDTTFCRQSAPLVKNLRGPGFIPWFEASDSSRQVDLSSHQNLKKFLSKSKLFENEKIMCFNKPAGVHAYTVKSKKNGRDEKHFAIEDALHIVAKETGCESLYVCQAPHPLYSGVTILAKCDSAADAVRSAFRMAKRRNEFVRTDLAVTVGVPHPYSDVIKVPVEIKEINGTIQAVPVLNPSKTKLKQELVKPRQTLYSVLDIGNDVALIELKPRDGLGQQSLLHITCRLCQVLGDKEYSNTIVKVAGVRMLLNSQSAEVGVQKLTPGVKRLLALKSDEDVQKLPLHIHRWKLLLPKDDRLGLSNKTVLTAPLPSYFVENMQLLGLQIPNTELH